MSGVPQFGSLGVIAQAAALFPSASHNLLGAARQPVESAMARRIRLASERVAKLETLLVRKHSVDPAKPLTTQGTSHE